MLSPAALARRKALLTTQAEIDRARVASAALELRRELLPPRAPAGDAAPRPVVARLVGIAVPLLGANRSLRAVRMLSLALAAYRLIGRLRGQRGFR